MGTLWQKFPGIDRVQEKIAVYPIACRFTVPLIAGKFVYQSVAVYAFTGNAGELFVLDGVTLAANLDQLVFNNALDPTFNSGLFSLDIVRAGNGHSVALAPFRFAAYNQGSEFSVNWGVTGTERGEEKFNFVLTGGLIQTPEIIALGKTSIDVVLTANVYRVKQNLFTKGQT